MCELTLIFPTSNPPEGFESGSFSAWTDTSGSPTASNSWAHHGTYSCFVDSHPEGVYKDLTLTNPTYMRIYVKINSVPTSDNYRLGLCRICRSSDNGGILAEIYKDSGVTYLALYNTIYGVRSFTDIQVSANDIYCIEIKFSGTNGVNSELYVDGNLKATVSYCPFTPNRVWVGYGTAGNASASAYIDCVVVADEYIGPENGSGNDLEVDNLTVNNLLTVGTDTNLYRSVADVLKTDDTFQVGSSIQLAASTGYITGVRGIFGSSDYGEVVSVRHESNPWIGFKCDNYPNNGGVVSYGGFKFWLDRNSNFSDTTFIIQRDSSPTQLLKLDNNGQLQLPATGSSGGGLDVAGHAHFSNSSSLITRQQLNDHLYKVGQAPEEFNWNTIPQYVRFHNPTTEISAYMFCPSLSDGGNEPVLYWSKALAVRKDIVSGGRLDSMEGVVSLLGGVGWGPDGYDSNPFIWLVGNQHGYPDKDTLEIRTSTYSGGWIWSWGNIACGNIKSAGSLYLTGNDNGYLWNNGGYIRQSGGYGFVADGYVVVGTLSYGSYGPLYLDEYHKISFLGSSIRYKENVETVEDASWIYNLRPVNFDWKDQNRAKEEGRQLGLIAEEVNELYPQLTWLDSEGKPEGVHYEWLGIPLLVEVKKLRKRVEALEKQLKQNTTAAS